MYRNEKKYIINKYQIELLKNRLSTILIPDENTKNDKGYFIRSLYFDNYKNDSYFEVINGISDRKKYRIRFYDYDTSYITLEKKSKVNNLGKKKKDIINKKIVNDFINNKEINTKLPLVNELIRGIKLSIYKPVVIIDYMRLAYTYSINDVRITIDYNISCSYEFNNFFSKDINSIPILEKDTAVLEVKYNGYLPQVIKMLIKEVSLERTSFSKYSNGREMLEKIERSV